jgi:hypothetical protein
MRLDYKDISLMIFAIAATLIIFLTSINRMLVGNDACKSNGFEKMTDSEEYIVTDGLIECDNKYVLEYKDVPYLNKWNKNISNYTWIAKH